MNNTNSEALAYLKEEKAPTGQEVAEKRARLSFIEEQVLEFKKEAWKLGGVIKKFREIDGHLLAQVRISEELKTLALEIDKSDEELEKNRQKSELPRIGKGRESVILALKNREQGIAEMGGRHADKLGQEAIDAFFTEIVSQEEFKTNSEAIEGCLSESEERSGKLKSEDAKGKLRLVK